MNTEMILLILCMVLSAVALIMLIVLLSRRPGAGAETVEDIVAYNREETERSFTGTLRAIGEESRRSTESIARVLNESHAAASRAQESQLDRARVEMNESRAQMRDELRGQMQDMARALEQRQDRFTETVSASMTELRASVTDQMKAIDERMARLSEANASAMDSMRRAMGDNMERLREENKRQLDEIRGTVDEKLQSTLEKRISESFKNVSEQLEKVHRGLGEMQTLAGDVGGLKKVLSGVKTRGILGEIRLGAILEDILAPDQFETNIATVPGSAERVEFAVKLPGDGDRPVYLPIDSKFPGDTYQRLLDAQADGDKAAIAAAYRDLETVITNEARDIAAKYIHVPDTTAFGIMFLPFEGLYAEVVSHGIMDRLRRKYNINIAGPSTMAALLNSLQMGFRTLAIRKHSSEIYNVLRGVEQEFDKFGEVLENMQKHLNQTSGDLEKLMSTRTNTIRRQLNRVQRMSDLETPISLTDSIDPSAED